MLELKHIKKTYKPKKGVPVQALKDISLSFEDSGMVFLLGKSGSGKSTLLNLIGGLDFADSGEIVIDGKSSKDFKQADYDSYRNTYVGFVFQEYNILNEFTVGENISLALELQSQKSDKNRLEEVLKEVDLEGYADRKPNELSGGQKQRVAIARAIIKDPKIIMADEPTGALDSETGKAIFDTLKRLSKDRLVIVVSHDREFAEQYGDRIIELADGEVISDKTVANIDKTNEKPTVELKKSRLPYRRAFTMGGKSMRTKPIRLAITIILCIISFAFFGLADTLASYNTGKATVKSIMKNNYDTLAITSGGGAVDKDLDYLNSKLGIEFMGVANFGATQALSVIYNKKVRGASGKDVYYNLSLSGYLPADKIIDGKKYKLIAGEMPKNDNEIALSKYTYEQYALGGIRLVDGEEIFYIEPEEIATPQDFVEKAYFQSDTQDGLKTWKVVGVVDTLEDQEGRYAQLKPNAKRDDMLAEKYNTLSAECSDYFNYSYHSIGFITQKAYEQICSLGRDKSLLGASAQGNFTFNSSPNSYLGTFINVVDDTYLNDFKIDWTDGNARAKLNDNEFVIGLKFLEALGNDVPQYKKVNVSQTFFEGLIDFSSFDIYFDSLKEYVGVHMGCYQYAESVEESQLNKFKEFINSLGSDQDEDARQLIRAIAVSECFNSVPYLSSDYELDVYAEEFSDVQWRLLYAGYLLTEKLDFYNYIDSIDGGYLTNVTDGPSGRQIGEKSGLEIYNKYLIKEINEMKFDNLIVAFDYGKKHRLEISPRIVGVYADEYDSEEDIYLINNLVYSYAKKSLIPDYAFLIAPMTEDKQIVNTLVNMHYGNDGENVYAMHNSVMIAMGHKGSTFSSLGKVFLYVGLALAVFSIALMSNYIAVSISSQKKQIGILRALGARSSDVFAIFYSESLIISIVNFVLATVSAFFASVIVNAKVAGDFGLQITFMLFGIRQIALMLALSIGVSLIASVVSIYSIAKRKPIDCILDK